VIALTESRSKIVFRPLPSDDPLQRKPDIGVARKRLGWKPSTRLDQGLRATISYFSE
jgi:UDP-glucuronate decarboxylase